MRIGIFGCAHRRETRPMTVGGRTWRTCLECGHERIVDRACMESPVRPRLTQPVERRLIVEAPDFWRALEEIVKRKP